MPWRDDAFLRTAGAGAAPLERPRPACGRAGIRRRRAFPPAALAHKPSPVAPPLFTPRPDPRLRLRALCRPCGRPKPPFPGALAAAAIARSFFASYPARRAAAAVSCLLRRFYGYRHKSDFASFLIKMFRAHIFSLRYHIIFTIICYNNQNRITVKAHSRREEGHCRKKRRNRHGKNTHCGR